jgi:hypothetical protein
VTRAAGAAQARGPSAALLARATFAALVVAAVAAVFIAQELKREAPLIRSHRPHSEAFPGPGHRFAHFNVTATLGGNVDVTILTAAGERPVKVIAAHLRIHEYQEFRLVWDGTTTAGTPAPAGLYLVEVHFEQYGRTAIVPRFVLTFRGAAG